jgi:hypothetical protein
MRVVEGGNAPGLSGKRARGIWVFGKRDFAGRKLPAGEHEKSQTT